MISLPVFVVWNDCHTFCCRADVDIFIRTCSAVGQPQALLTHVIVLMLSFPHIVFRGFHKKTIGLELCVLTTGPKTFIQFSLLVFCLRAGVDFP